MKQKEKSKDTVSVSGNGQRVTITADDLKKVSRNIVQHKMLWDVLELDGRPDDRFEIPQIKEFSESEFISADDVLLPFYEALRRHFHDEFWFLEEARVKLFWKEKGGSSGGSDTLGKCQKPSGLLRHYSDCDFIIWIAADHCRARGFTNWQILALLYHEMRHTNFDNNTGKLTLQGHQFEGFVDELERFGGWRLSALNIIEAARRLPGME
jgi:hypothetical protein